MFEVNCIAGPEMLIFSAAGLGRLASKRWRSGLVGGVFSVGFRRLPIPLRAEGIPGDSDTSSSLIENKVLDDRRLEVDVEAETSDASDVRFESNEEVVDRLLGSEPTESLLIKIYLTSSSWEYSRSFWPFFAFRSFIRLRRLCRLSRSSCESSAQCPTPWIAGQVRWGCSAQSSRELQEIGATMFQTNQMNQ